MNGSGPIGGNSTAPTNLKSFCGGFVNMVFMVSSMLSGACATPEFLMYLNYFIGKEYGIDYWKEADKVVDLSVKQRTTDKIITDCFEQIVYPSTSLPAHAIIRLCSGTWLIMTNHTSRVSSATLCSPTDRSPTGTDCHGCRSAS